MATKEQKIEEEVTRISNDEDLRKVVKYSIDELNNIDRNIQQLQTQAKEILLATKEKGIDPAAFKVLWKQSKVPAEHRDMVIESAQAVSDAVSKIWS